MEGFQYESERLDYYSVERTICDHYELGYANSSNFLEIQPGWIGQAITIFATKGSISCYVNADPKKNSTLFSICVSYVKIKRK